MNARIERRSLLALLAVLPLAACSVEAKKGGVLRFTAIPDHNKTELQAKYDPLAAHLSEALGIHVEYVPTEDYSSSVEMFKNGDIDLAWFGGLTGVQARAAVDGAQAIAQGTLDPHFKSYFIANAATGIEPSDEFPKAALRGKTFTFGSEQSTSGRLMPEYYIREMTTEAPDAYFSKVGFSGSHDKTALLVEAGTWDVGALNFDTYDKMVAEGKIDPAVCRIIWTTPEYADYNWTIRPDVDGRFGAGTLDRVQEALIGLQDPVLLTAAQRPGGLILATNDDFAGIEAVARDLGFVR